MAAEEGEADQEAGRSPDEPPRTAIGRLTVPWTVLLIPFIAPVTFFGEDNWAKVLRLPVIGGVARTLSSGVFESADVKDAADVPFDTTFLPTAGLAVFVGYQVLVQFLPRLGISPTFSADVPNFNPPSSGKAEAEDAAEPGDAGADM